MRVFRGEGHEELYLGPQGRRRAWGARREGKWTCLGCGPGRDGWKVSGRSAGPGLMMMTEVSLDSASWTPEGAWAHGTRVSSPEEANKDNSS